MDPAALVGRSLLGLPLGEWARRMRRGEVRLEGTAERQSLSVWGHELLLGPGRVRARIDFEGGERPVLRRVRVDGPLVIGGVAGGVLHLEEGALRFDEVPLAIVDPAAGLRLFLAALVRGLSDVRVEALTEPEEDVLLQMGHGLEVKIAPGVPLSARGETRGPPEALQLCAPLVIGFGGEGIHLNHDRLEWLARRADLRIGRATLHPDGQVDLQGRAAPGFDLALRGSLQSASAGLSTLVRHGPAFRHLRRFLRRPR